MLVKVGMEANELHWTTQLAQAAPDLLPTLFASGDRLGELEVCRGVLEQIPFGPLGPLWKGHEFAMALEAGVRFQHAARSLPVGSTPRLEPSTVRGWMEEALPLRPPGPAEQVAAQVEADFAWLAATCGVEVCHNDLHLCNFLTRTPPPAPSRAVLIDVGGILQPWPLPVAYLQVLNSTDRARPGAQDLVPKMAGLRRHYGLPVPDDADLARVGRPQPGLAGSASVVAEPGTAHRARLRCGDSTLYNTEGRPGITKRGRGPSPVRRSKCHPTNAAWRSYHG